MKNMEAFAGIDVAFAKRKVLPVVVCVRSGATLLPLSLRTAQTIVPPRGRGNAKALDQKVICEFADATAHYLHAVEKEFGVTISRIAIDAPSGPRSAGMPRRQAERALDDRHISCFATPDEREFRSIRLKAETHLREGGQESRLPHANQLWMLVGFELFRRLREDWECLEVFPNAIAVSLGSAAIHKTREDGFRNQLSSLARYTGWPETAAEASLADIGYGKPHDRLDAYLAAWVASLEDEFREALGTPPDDAIWIPRIADLPQGNPGDVLRPPAIPPLGGKEPPMTISCRCCERNQKKDLPRICPECSHVFRGNGWDGVDAHWRAKHEHVMPYLDFWENLCPEHRATDWATQTLGTKEMA
jgi:hypothetical protein